MRKLLTLVGLGFLTLAGLFFYAEQKRASAEGSAAVNAIRDVLRAQNQAFAGRLFEALGRADQDALATLNRFRKVNKTRAFLSDTALTEPEAPRWVIVAGRRIKAAGVADDPLLEDALEAHQNGPARLALYQAQGKYYLFIKGTLEGQPYAAGYAPAAFFAGLRSSDGLRPWVALADGTVIYHPVPRFVGTNAANLKPVAAGIAELKRQSSAPYVSQYLSLEGSEALGALTPLPSYGALVATEWPKLPAETNRASALFWFATALASLGLLALGGALRRGGSRASASAAEPRLFDESRLDQDALEYLDEARAAAERAVRAAEERALAADELGRESHDALNQVGAIEWKSRVTEDYLDRVLPKVSTRQVWEAFAQLVTRQSPEVSAIVYRYSSSSFSLTPECLHSRAELPEGAAAYLKDARIFVGKPELLDDLTRTEAFQRWNKSRERQMPSQRTTFRVIPLGGADAGPRWGVLVLFFDERLNAGGELQLALGLFESLARRTATFCDSLLPLLHSTHANGNARPPLASTPNQPGNRPRPS